MGAATDLLRRRAMMPQGDDYLKGWTMNAVLTSASNPNTIGPSDTYCVSPFFAIPDGCRVIASRYAVVEDCDPRLRRYLAKADYSYLDGTTSKPIARWGVQNGAVYFRYQCFMSDIDYCYVYDETHNVYLFKGKNVT